MDVGFRTSAGSGAYQTKNRAPKTSVQEDDPNMSQLAFWCLTVLACSVAFAQSAAPAFDVLPVDAFRENAFH
jgi:hypothetical protein